MEMFLNRVQKNPLQRSQMHVATARAGRVGCVAWAAWAAEVGAYRPCLRGGLKLDIGC